MRGFRFNWNAIVVALSAFLLIAATSAHAEQLSIRTYTTADGLAYNVVRRIVPDSRGFLWFCTALGLSRFDDTRFTSYGTEHGLPAPSINDLVETRNGDYWIATNGGGVSKFEPKNAADVSEKKLLFTAYTVGEEAATNRVNVLYEDRTGILWAGTDAGLFRLDKTIGRFVP